MNYSLTFGGILVMVLGSVLVDGLGISANCSSELTAKASEYAPLIIGGLMSLIGRYRMGGVTKLGFRTH